MGVRTALGRAAGQGPHGMERAPSRFSEAERVGVGGGLGRTGGVGSETDAEAGGTVRGTDPKLGNVLLKFKSR